MEPDIGRKKNNPENGKPAQTAPVPGHTGSFHYTAPAAKRQFVALTKYSKIARILATVGFQNKKGRSNDPFFIGFKERDRCGIPPGGRAARYMIHWSR
jgi:hypothetical protein